MRKIVGVYPAPAGVRWVGDGFPVRSLFSHHEHGARVSPFLLFDYAGPADFSPTGHRRGVGQHPHRGFETVTIVYDGEVAHRDSTGAGGLIGPGDVQWMTAGSGVLHEEYHSEAFARSGGRFEVVQLWVNLPARDKMTAPRYQTLLDNDIPRVELPEGAGVLRVIAGEYDGVKGPARTFTPIDIWDIRLDKGEAANFTPHEGHSLIIVVLGGAIEINGQARAKEAEVVVFEMGGGALSLSALADTKLLLLSGEPIDEPVAQQGPFVMNTAEEIKTAYADYESGRFGAIAPQDA
ncbi:pirin family protein [Methylocystis sp. WRRC1]|uniref:pirin family protein n=1 Tax=Methylocystis sp. WRRC1 TaxID=1732014 RepID=UPI001D15D113|nr:pirin family protein [Methylocystis sp. WRRC1]MCC3244599.1 pirin family protein [Methylocystis sp. WRRC1]